MAVYLARLRDRASGQVVTREIEAGSLAEAGLIASQEGSWAVVESVLPRGGTVEPGAQAHPLGASESGDDSSRAWRSGKRSVAWLRATSQQCFRVYYAPDVIRVVWVLGAVLLLGTAVVFPMVLLIDAARHDAVQDALADWRLYVMPLVLVCMTVGLRLTLECVAVLFDMLAELRKLNARIE